MKDGNAGTDQKRRRFIKQLTIGAGTIVGIGAIPHKWVKPLVGVGTLPAHAQVSGPSYPVSSTPPTLSATNNLGDTGDDIYIIFDGAYDLQLALAGDLDPTPANALIGIDTDPGVLTTWEAYNSGSNWTITNNGGITIPGGPNASSTYTIVVSGFAQQFQLTFTVNVSGPNPPTATVSAASIQPV